VKEEIKELKGLLKEEKKDRENAKTKFF